MKIIQYNIYNGCQSDPDRLVALCDWLRDQNADVVGLNELNGWAAKGVIHDNAEAAGYSHASLFRMEQSVHFVGAMTRDAHEVVLREEAGFHHGLLGINYRDTTILITHLTPTSAADRRDECKLLANIISGLPGPVLLMGDLNTLSPLDRDYLEQPAVLTQLRNTPLLTRKFLDQAGQLDFVPMETLLDAGLTDLGAKQKLRHSVPTPFNQDHAHALPLRLDYMLANSAFQTAMAGQAKVDHGTSVEQLSDHFPLVFSG